MVKLAKFDFAHGLLWIKQQLVTAAVVSEISVLPHKFQLVQIVYVEETIQFVVEFLLIITDRWRQRDLSLSLWQLWMCGLS